ncbi:MAG: hypothetical protein ACE5OZ_01070 [Candidatus Heimdallarchaeota archaeon]
MQITDAIRFVFLVGILLLIVSFIGFAIGSIGFLPFERSDQIEFNTEIALSNTTQLYDIPANSYRLNCQVKINGYQYGLLGNVINHIGGLHGPNYANITFLANQTVLFSKSISDIPADRRFSSQLELTQTSDITVRADFTLKDFPGNEDYYFDIAWSFSIEEKDFYKEKAEWYYANREATLVWGIFLILGAIIVLSIQ